MTYRCNYCGRADIAEADRQRHAEKEHKFWWSCPSVAAALAEITPILEAR